MHPRQDGSTEPLTRQQTMAVAIPPSPTPPSSQASAASTSASNEPDGAPSPSARSTPMPPPSSPSDGRESRTWVTSRPWLIRTVGDYGDPTLMVEEDGLPMLAANPMSDRTMLVGVPPPSGPAASPARTSPSPASDEDWPESDPASPTPSSTLWDDTDLAPSSWRTFRASSAPMPAATLGRSSASWGNSGMGGPSGWWTLSGSECPSDEGGCSSSPSTLSDILMREAPPRYSLSARAAAGIIRRSERRGRELPGELATALEALATQPMPSRPRQVNGEVQSETISPSSWTVRRLTPTECERLMGWPDGWTVVEGWRKSSARSASTSALAPIPTTPSTEEEAA